MKRVVLAFIATLLAACPAYAEDFTGKCVRVIDGDTIAVQVNGYLDPVRVRLQGIDAPERDQPYGDEAALILASLAYGKDVTVVDGGEDKYGRHVGRVLTSDCIDLNLSMVGCGLAWWYKPYARKDHTMEQLEERARFEGIGLWATGGCPVPPWAWRKMNKEQKAAALTCPKAHPAGGQPIPMGSAGAR